MNHGGFRAFGGWRQQADLPPAGDLEAWLRGFLPDDWFEGPPEVVVDQNEIIIVGRLAAPDAAEGADEAARAAAESGRIARFREETREQRIGIAQHLEQRYRRKVAWGARAGGTREMFTNLSVPVMTRLRQPERQVLDTLVNAGVARSRSEALAWCVRLVGEHADAWLSELRTAMAAVDRLRAKGPEVD